ncbi:hypothetical protein PUN28_014825 [Cardiocondyla obscurior]
MDLLNERVVEFLNSTYKFPNCRRLIHTLYYLLVSILHKESFELKSFALHLFSEIEIDDGLPCPASSTVCIAACLMHWSQLQKGPHDTFDDDDLEVIDTYAKCYGTIYPELDEINVTASVFGLIRKFIINETGSSLISTIEVQDLPTITILLVNSKKTQSIENLKEIKVLQIEDQKEQIKILKNSVPDVFESIWENIEKVSLNAYDLLFNLARIHGNSEETFQTRYLTTLNLYTELKTFISINQSFLQALRLTNADMDEICLIARKHEMAGKHTDICGGRYVFILCPLTILDSSTKRIERLMINLHERGFTVKKTNLAQKGVTIEPEEY